MAIFVDVSRAARRLFALSVLVGLASCAPPPPPPEPPPQPVKKAVEVPVKAPETEDIRLLAEADQLLEEGRQDQAERLYGQLILQYPRSQLVGVAHARAGRLFLERGALEDAQTQFRAALTAPPHALRNQAQADLGRVRLIRGEKLTALADFGGLLQEEGAEAPVWWGLFLSAYLSLTPEESVGAAALLPTGPFTPGQARAMQAAIRLLSPAALEKLALGLPLDSPLLAHARLSLGDAAVREGEEEKGRAIWRAVAEGEIAPAAAREALLRLTPPRTDQPVQLGLLLPLEGRYAVLGKTLIQAAQKALSDHRDVPLQLVLADSGGEEGKARSAFKFLATRNVHAVIGPVFHLAAAAAAEQAVLHGLPIITLNPHEDIALIDPRGGGRPTVFMNALRPADQAGATARFAAEKAKRRRAAVLAPLSEYGDVTLAAFKEAFEAKGGEIVSVARFPEKEGRDFSPWIKQLVHLDKEAEKARMAAMPQRFSLDPVDPPIPASRKDLEPWIDFDALFIPARADQARLIAPQLAFFEVDRKRVSRFGASLWNRPALLSEGTDYLRGSIFPDTEEAARMGFDKGYAAAWNGKPIPLAALVYDAVAAIAELVRDERLGGPAWGESFNRKAGFRGATGRVVFGPDGLSRHDYQFFTINRTGVVPLP